MTTPLNFHKIGLLYRTRSSQSRVMAAEMLEFIETIGATAWVSDHWHSEAIADKLEATDLLVALGGDGSMIRAAHLALGNEIPVLGVNQGNLGFLAEVQPAEWPQRFETMLTGSFWLEDRLVIRAEHWRQGQCLGDYYALNEVSVSRTGAARVIRLETFINDCHLTTYTADGMILATPTGSTAYALAAGGPVLPPELKNILLVPIAPHLSFDRGLVLSEGDQVKLKINTSDTACMTVDGHIDVPLLDGDLIAVRASDRVSRFLRLRERTYFYQTLMQRLGWPQPK